MPHLATFVGGRWTHAVLLGGIRSLLRKQRDLRSGGFRVRSVLPRQLVHITVQEGLARPLRREIEDLVAGTVHEVQGGVEAVISLSELYSILYHSRLAESVRLFVGTPAKCTNWNALGRHALAQPWRHYLRPDAGSNGLPEQFAINAKTEDSRLYEKKKVMGVVNQAIRSKLVDADLVLPPNEDFGGDPTSSKSAAAVFVENRNNMVQFSVNASGSLLFERAYLVDRGGASVRASNAAAVLNALGLLLPVNATAAERWRHIRELRLWDPCCGGGSFVLELAASLLFANAIGYPYCKPRDFAFHQWPIVAHPLRKRYLLLQLASKQLLVEKELAALYAAEHPDKDPITSVAELLRRTEFVWGSDIAESAIKVAQANAREAKLFHPQLFTCADLATCAQSVPQGTRILTNLPWGIRTGTSTAVATYEKFARLLSDRPDIAIVHVLLERHAVPVFTQVTGLRWNSVLGLSTGGRTAVLLALQRNSSVLPT